jgi:hypothetical protein
MRYAFKFGVIVMAEMPKMSNEDLSIVKAFLIYPVVLDVLERDMKIMAETEMKMAELYRMKLKSVQIEMMKDQYEIRNQLRIRGIKVYEQTRSNTSLDGKYVHRGYHHTFSMLWSKVKTEVTLALCKHLEIDIADERLK